jgi:hypothetical protein
MKHALRVTIDDGEDHDTLVFVYYSEQPTET